MTVYVKEIRPGQFVRYQGDIWQVEQRDIKKPAKGPMIAEIQLRKTGQFQRRVRITETLETKIDLVVDFEEQESGDAAEESGG
jgi:translation elongation factor P/translation initiation factor 5A